MANKNKISTPETGIINLSDYTKAGRPVGERLVTAKDVAASLLLSVSQVYRMISLGQFPKPMKFGVKSRWKESDIRAYIARQEKAARG